MLDSVFKYVFECLLLSLTISVFVYLNIIDSLCLWVEFWVGWLHRVHLGVSSIFMWYSLLLVMQVFLSTLYCRSLASMARDVLLSFIICFSRISGANSWSDWN